MKDGFKRFVNYLFQVMILQTCEHDNESSTYIYYRPKKDEEQGNFVNYVLDYNYILFVLTHWGIRELGAEESNFFRFIAQFSSLNSGLFLKKNYFLVTTIFNQIFDVNPYIHNTFMKNPKKKYKLEIKYYTPFVVQAMNEKMYYFMGVVFPGAEILKYLDEDVVHKVFEGRLRNNLKLIYSGMDATKKSSVDGEMLEAFWKIAHPLIEKKNG
jgi:hypothetical protein